MLQTKYVLLKAKVFHQVLEEYITKIYSQPAVDLRMGLGGFGPLPTSPLATEIH